MKSVKLNSPVIGYSERRAAGKVLKSGQLAQSKEVSEFEDSFSDFVEGRYCIAVNSGTSALHTIFVSLGIGPGDEVLVPNFTFAASANSVAITGAKVILVDVDIRTFTIDINDLVSKISSRSKAILVVHLYGLPGNMPEILKVSQERGLFVVEDAAQAHLAEIQAKRVGTFGVAAAFSFYPTKNMTSCEGGMIVTSEEYIRDFSKKFRNQGMLKRYENEIVGLNYRMTEIHAAIGVRQLRKIVSWTQRRQDNAAYLSERLKNYVEVPFVPEGYSHVFHQYTIKVTNNRETFIQKLWGHGIASDVYYPFLISDLPSFKSSHLHNPFPVSRKLSETVLSLPVHPKLSTKDLKRVCHAVIASHE